MFYRYRAVWVAPEGAHVTATIDDALTHRGFPKAELIDDYRLALVSRSLDDREISLQKQSRVFFQISGAGHEALLLALTHSLHAGYDWFFPYYRDRALVLGLGVTPLELLLEAVGSADDPASGGRQMPCHWGHREKHIVTQSSPTGSQCLPAVGCAEATRYIQGRSLPGCNAHGDEITYVSLGEGATSEGEFWESLNTACRLHLPVLYIVADNGYAISVRAEDQSPAPISEMVRGFRGLAVTKIDGRDYFQARHFGARAVARVRAGEGPGLVHAKVTRPYSHSAADTQSKYRPAEELADEASHDPDPRARARLGAERRLDRRRRQSHPRRGEGHRGRRRQAGTGRGEAGSRIRARARVRAAAHPRTSRAADGGRQRDVRRSDPAHAARADGCGRAHPRVR